MAAKSCGLLKIKGFQLTEDGMVETPVDETVLQGVDNSMGSLYTIIILSFQRHYNARTGVDLSTGFKHALKADAALTSALAQGSTIKKERMVQ